MASPFLGQIMLFGGNFAPRGWAFCNGQLLAISTNTALFSLLGTTYGGNGTSNFALPDLRGRVPIGQGQGLGLTTRNLGEIAGSETVTLISTQIPAHTHTLGASTAPATQGSPASAALAAVDGTAYTATAPNTTLAPASIGITGGSQPHENMQPYIAMNYIIALQGIFPSRS